MLVKSNAKIDKAKKLDCMKQWQGPKLTAKCLLDYAWVHGRFTPSVKWTDQARYSVSGLVPNISWRRIGQNCWKRFWLHLSWSWRNLSLKGRVMECLLHFSLPHILCQLLVLPFPSTILHSVEKALFRFTWVPRDPMFVGSVFAPKSLFCLQQCCIVDGQNEIFNAYLALWESYGQ